VSRLSEDEREELRAAARGTLERWWERPSGDRPDGAGATAMWDQAVGLGWTDLAGSLDALAVVAEESGRAICPLPVADAAAAALVFADVAGVREAVLAGGVRPTAAFGAAVELAELGEQATHLLVLDDHEARLAPVVRTTPVEGLARPRWCTVEVGEAQAVALPGVDLLERARDLLALGAAARAMGAARRAHELATQHAVDRVQFGRPIGSYQAVSHRLADAAVDLAGWDTVVADLGGGGRDDDHPGGDDLSEVAGAFALQVAVAHATGAAARVMRAAQRTLAAIGYFEEHEGPWLFRRVHADLSRLQGDAHPERRVGLALIDGRAPLLRPAGVPDPLVEELAADLDALEVPASSSLDDDPAVVAELGRRGWIAPGLPVEVGGRDASLTAQMAIDAVLQRRQVPARVARGVGATLAGVLSLYGSPEQQREVVPLIASGGFRCYLGYSEPDVGSDLASLSTRAQRDGDEWVVHGEKLWGTGAQHADHVWLAARTDPDAPKREGITVFLAPTRLPGWSCTPHTALSGEVSCTTVFDGVRIPDSCRVGPEGGGWTVITAALAAERVVMAGLAAEVGRQLEQLIDLLRTLSPDRRRASELGRLATRHRVAASLLAASVAAVDAGGGWMEAAMAKLVTGDLAEEVALAAFDSIGPDAATGPFDHALRLAPMYVIGGGTGDVQRNLVARGLGLPR